MKIQHAARRTERRPKPVLAGIYRYLPGMLAAWMAVGAGPARASADLAVSPTTINLAPAGRGSGLSLTNNGKAPVVVKADILAWGIRPSGDVLEPTDDFLVMPPEFEIAPGATQVVRVARTYRGAPAAAEQSYRLLLTEQLPALGEVAATPDIATSRRGEVLQISTRLSISVPVFILPGHPDQTGNDPHDTLSWKVVGAGKDHLWVEVASGSNMHRRIDGLQARDSEGHALSARTAALFYVLPGQITRVQVPLSRPVRPGETLALAFNEAYQPWSQALAVPSPLPAEPAPPLPSAPTPTPTATPVPTSVGGSAPVAGRSP